MSFYHLVYFSVASRPLKQEDINDIVAVSSKNNQQAGITGMLVYRMGFFIQLLEGEKASVENIYAKIEKDPRHRSSQVLLSYESEARIFPQWYMGLISEPLDAKELFSLVNDFQRRGSESTEELTEKAVALLKKFSEKYPNP